jgi:hypothetical protein
MAIEPEKGSAGVSANRPSEGRRKAFRIIAWFMAGSAVLFGLYTAVFGIISESQSIHAYHNVVVASLLIVLSAPAAVAAARAPERSWPALLHLVALGVAAVATMILALRADVFTLPFAVLTGVLVALRVAEGPAMPPGRASPVLAVLVVASAVPLLAYALGQAELQRLDTTSEHAEFNHWVETSFYAVAVVLLGALAAIRPMAYRLSGWCAGVGLAIIGGASLLLSDHASALDAPWAWAALAGGITFAAGTEWERARSTPTHVTPA